MTSICLNHIMLLNLIFSMRPIVIYWIYRFIFLFVYSRFRSGIRNQKAQVMIICIVQMILLCDYKSFIVFRSYLMSFFQIKVFLDLFILILFHRFMFEAEIQMMYTYFMVQMIIIIVIINICILSFVSDDLLVILTFVYTILNISF